MAARSLDELEDFVREKIEQEHTTHGKLSELLCSRYPGVRGFSIRSIQRFCHEKGIHKTSRLSQADVEDVVSAGVSKVYLCKHIYSSHILSMHRRLTCL